MKRKVDLVVLSDIHLGTYGCHAKELLQYLETVEMKTLVLNGDIIDVWQFKKKYWPKPHMQVLQHILSLVADGVEVIYVTGNHDEVLRRFADNELGTFQLVNKKVLELNGEKAWIFHGDVFDVTMQHAKWLTKLGATSYDLLILLNKFVNLCLERMGKEKMSLSKKVKNSVKSAVKFINSFEETAAEIAIAKGYDYVICGHIHKPENRVIKTRKGEVKYLNSGDWVEHLSALEYHNGEWSVYEYFQDEVAKNIRLKQSSAYLSTNELFDKLVQDFKLLVA